ncbi:MAG: hypothetical protein ACRD8A_10485 [Candidatus Acidiferrales bacterium]
MNRKCAALLLICLACGSRLPAQPHAHGGTGSCQRFAQTFYTWYVGQIFESFDKKNMDPLLQALGYKGHPFSRELEQGIRKVRAEEEKSHEAILDFDPILDTQDPAEHYVVRKVTMKSGHYWAEIYGVWPTPHPELGKRPEVVAEMSYQGRWIFVNFHYPGDPDPRSENLLSMLKFALR